MADVNYTGIGLEVESKFDSTGIDQGIKKTRELKQETFQFNQANDKSAESVEKVSKALQGLGLDQVKWANSLSKTEILTRKLTGQNSQLSKVLSAEKVDQSRVSSLVSSIQKATSELNKENLRQENPKTKDDAFGFAQATSKAKALEMQLQSAKEKLADLWSTGADQGKIGRAIQNVNTLAEKIDRLNNPPAKKEQGLDIAWGNKNSEAEATLRGTELTVTYKNLSEAVQETTEKENLLAGATSKVASAFASVQGVVSGVAQSIGNAVKDKIGSFAKGLNSIVGAFKRIAFYRVVRSIIKEIGQAFGEGVNNLYQWSKLLNGEFAQSMDRVATAGLYMKNSLGAMVSPLINALAPAVDYLIDRFVALLNVINQVLAAITGAATWTKAIKYPTEYAKAVGGAASNAKKLGLATIDQLTILDKQKGSSGSGFSANDYSQMFETKKLSDFWEKLKDEIANGEWRYAGKMLADKLNEIIDSFDARAWGNKLGEKINNGLEFLYGFMRNTDFTRIGNQFSEIINGLLDGINFDTVGRLWARKFTAVIDFVIGAIQSLDWSLVGESINNMVVGALNEFTQWARGVDWVEIATDLWFGFTDMLDEVDWSTIAKRLFELFGIAIGAAVDLLAVAIGDVVNSIVDYFAQYIEDENNDGHFGAAEIISGICEGIVEAMKGIGQWIVENIFDPFVKGLKEAFGIASPAKKMMPFGEDIIAGIKEGASRKWEDMLNWFRTKWESFKNWWKGLSLPSFQIKTPHISWYTEPAGGWISNVLSALGLPTSIPKMTVSWYAKGGFPEDGLFMANHNELVGQFSNGKTAVANNAQIVEGIREGVYDAMVSALGNGRLNANVYLDGKQISGTVVSNINSETRRTGNSPLLSY